MPLFVTKDRSSVAGKKVPREGIEEESKCHTYDRPHLSISTLIPVNNTHVRQYEVFCQTIQLNYYMADKSKENNKLLLCRSLKKLDSLRTCFCVVKKKHVNSRQMKITNFHSQLCLYRSGKMSLIHNSFLLSFPM